MKNIKNLLIGLLSMSFLMVSCEGPTGPPGRNGTNGASGDDFSSTVIFEIEGQNFIEENQFVVTTDIPDNIAITDGDLIFVYRRSRLNSTNGEVWELLPTNFFLEAGTLQYSFNHTSLDVDIVLDTNFELNMLTDQDISDFLTNQKFRIAVINSVDFNAQNGAKFADYTTVSQGAKLLNFTE
ncbi:hypothetical protein [Aquimarina agarivorans]|uniref:hypothetical protein n=1 Tax=Aquimarina agarivorans TaxID=980584 RepID=UPI0002D610F1|nr:hypothetical protein [Aquimarina agarivorans]